MVSDLSQLGYLLFVSALVAMLMRRLKLPYTVGLVLAGIGLSLLPFRVGLQLSKELIFFVFLPPLIFEAALYLHWRELKRELPVVGLLATLGVGLAAALTAAGMHYAAGWSWGSAIIFGVLIAATDPVSVIATFKEAAVQGRVRVLIEAESLLNDGTAAVAFVAALSLADGATSDYFAIVRSLLLTIAGGTLCGAGVGIAFVYLAGRTSDQLVKVTFSTLAAYGSFFFAEHFHLSGVLATLAAGLVMGNYRTSGLLSQGGRNFLESFWEYVAFSANSLIFLLIGAQEAQQHFSHQWWPVLVGIFLVTIGRAAAIYPLCAVYAASPLKVPMGYQHVLFWGGLRGALALALALGLPQSTPHHDDIITVAFAVVAFSIFAQGLTMKPLLRHYGLLAPHVAATDESTP